MTKSNIPRSIEIENQKKKTKKKKLSKTIYDFNESYHTPDFDIEFVYFYLFSLIIFSSITKKS